MGEKNLEYLASGKDELFKNFPQEKGYTAVEQQIFPAELGSFCISNNWPVLRLPWFGSGLAVFVGPQFLAHTVQDLKDRKQQAGVKILPHDDWWMTARQHTGIRSKIRKKSLKPPPRTLLSSNIAFSKIFYRNLLHLLLKERGTLEHFRCKETRCFSCLLWEAESTSLALEKDIDWSHKLGAISIEHWNCGRKILLQVSCFIFTINKLFF